MSGGFFDYQQHRLEDMARDIDRLVARNGTSYADDPSLEVHYPPDIIERFKETAHILRQAAEMAQRVDYLLSADDGEDTFRERWAKEVRPYWVDINHPGAPLNS